MSQPFRSLRCCIPLESEYEDESDACSVASLPPFSPTLSVGASSHTSYDQSRRSASPVPSVVSMTSTLRAQAFRQEYGRGMNNYSEIYRLPADEEEIDRLDKQHIMLQEIMGKYPPVLEEVMADDVPGETKACLDLGCGSGTWIMELARDFPNCSTVAVDLVPMQSPSMPPNCRSEVDDINLGLEHFYGDFNVVHARFISTGIKDYWTLIDQISRVLRPGGLVELQEYDFKVYDENKKYISVGTHQLGPPWLPRWVTFARQASKNLGAHVEAADNLHSWILNHPAFEDVVYREYWVPVSPWFQGNEKQLRISCCMREDILGFLKSGRPLLLGSGLSEEMVNELQEGAAKELLAAQSRQLVRIQNVYARKKVQ